MRGLLKAATFALAALAAVGCTDRIPTLTGTDPFPRGGEPNTIELILDASEFLNDVSVYGGRTERGDARFSLVANQSDGALSSHVLAAFEFPDTINVGVDPDSTFSYGESTVVATIPDTLSTVQNALTFYLWSVAEPWDTATVSWEYAVDAPGERRLWSQPGGTPGELLAVTRWVRSDTVAADSVIWELAGEQMNQLSEEDVVRLMVTLEDPGSQVNISGLAIRAQVSPTEFPDAIDTRTIQPTWQGFIYTPEAPAPEDVIRVGGIRSDRSVLRISLPQMLPGCEPPLDCASLRPDQVTINRAELLLDPEPITPGFRSVAPIEVILRRVLELELGERAPLGPGVDFDSIPPQRFTPGEQEPVSFFIDRAVVQAYAEDDEEIGVALVVEPEASTFGFAWFDPRPRLRLVYTVHQTPQLP